MKGAKLMCGEWNCLIYRVAVIRLWFWDGFALTIQRYFQLFLPVGFMWWKQKYAVDWKNITVYWKLYELRWIFVCIHVYSHSKQKSSMPLIRCFDGESPMASRVIVIKGFFIMLECVFPCYPFFIFTGFQLKDHLEPRAENLRICILVVGFIKAARRSRLLRHTIDS